MHLSLLFKGLDVGMHDELEVCPKPVSPWPANGIIQVHDSSERID
jgi:hypothetical protein